MFQSVSPGLVDTEIFEVGGLRENIYSTNPYLQAKDIADAVTYVLSTPPSVQVMIFYTLFSVIEG